MGSDLGADKACEETTRAMTRTADELAAELETLKAELLATRLQMEVLDRALAVACRQPYEVARRATWPRDIGPTCEWLKTEARTQLRKEKRS